MKVLLINGSPNVHGCTYTALSEVAKALESDGVETEIFHIGNQAIHGCIGCGQCGKNPEHHCAFADDSLNTVIDKLNSVDGLVFGSPVHFASASGAITAFMDRLFWAASSLLAFKPAACVTSARRGGTTAALDQMNKYPGIRNMPIISGSYWNMVHGSTPEEVKKDLEGLQTMQNVGHNMAWILKCIQAGKESGLNHPVAVSGSMTNFIQE